MERKWEYCAVSTAPIGKDRIVIAFYGAAEINKRAQNLNAALWALGQAEWELVGSEPAKYLFKRPVQPGRAIDDAPLLERVSEVRSL